VPGSIQPAVSIGDRLMRRAFGRRLP